MHLTSLQSRPAGVSAAGAVPSAPASTVALLLATVLVAAAVFAAPVPAAAAEMTPFPDTYVFRPHVASHHRPGFALVAMAADEGIADSGAPRSLLRLGARFGLLRWAPEGYGLDVEGAPWALQLGLTAGFRGQFDGDYSLDNLGWDGNYGLLLGARVGERWRFKTGFYHTSAHVGDEYAERTGRTRLGYTREELVGAVAYRAAEHWRLYAEGGWGYNIREEIGMEPGRVQAGVEYEGPPRMLGRRAGWFAALDLSAWEENDWSLNPSLQAGLTFPGRERRWRVGLLAYDGRVPLGEFFQDEETYWGLGLWLDV